MNIRLRANIYLIVDFYSEMYINKKNTIWFCYISKLFKSAKECWYSYNATNVYALHMYTLSIRANLLLLNVGVGTWAG